MRRQIFSRTAVLIVVCLVLLTGCGSFRRMTGRKALRNAIANKFQVQEVWVALAPNDDLEIGLSDLAYETATAEVKLGKAQQVAEFVRDNYRDIGAVRAIRILLVTKADSSGFYQDIALQGAYLFDRDAKLKSNTVGPNPPTPRDLLLYGEQAQDGTVRNGMKLFPSFGARTAKTPIPANVGLDLAAFSAGPIYKDDHRFVLTADGQAVAEGTATYQSSGTIADGQTAEFMTITIGYAIFKQLAESREATLRIGTKEIQFTDLQRSIFKKMIVGVETGAGSDVGTR